MHLITKNWTSELINIKQNLLPKIDDKLFTYHLLWYIFKCIKFNT